MVLVTCGLRPQLLARHAQAVRRLVHAHQTSALIHFRSDLLSHQTVGESRATRKRHFAQFSTLPNRDDDSADKKTEDSTSFAMHEVLNVPNAITFARILSTPYLGYLIVEGDLSTAVGVLAVAGFSDWLDGFIARKFKQESIVGSFMDPLADKLMVGTLSLSTMWTGLIPAPLVVLVFGRDALLVAGTFYYRFKTKDATSAFFDTHDSAAFQVQPSMISKVNTALQFAMFGFALTNGAWAFPGDTALNALFGIVGTTTFLSGSEYLWSYWHRTGVFRHISKPK